MYSQLTLLKFFLVVIAIASTVVVEAKRDIYKFSENSKFNNIFDFTLKNRQLKDAFEELDKCPDGVLPESYSCDCTIFDRFTIEQSSTVTYIYTNFLLLIINTH